MTWRRVLTWLVIRHDDVSLRLPCYHLMDAAWRQVLKWTQIFSRYLGGKWMLGSFLKIDYILGMKNLIKPKGKLCLLQTWRLIYVNLLLHHCIKSNKIFNFYKKKIRFSTLFTHSILVLRLKKKGNMWTMSIFISFQLFTYFIPILIFTRKEGNLNLFFYRS